LRVKVIVRMKKQKFYRNEGCFFLLCSTLIFFDLGGKHLYKAPYPVRETDKKLYERYILKDKAV
jgi:hypothetical protein